MTPGLYSTALLTATQVEWARQIIDAAYAHPGTTDRDVVCALACVAQESQFWMFANDGTSAALTTDQQTAIKASLALPHDKVGHDSASVGLFQQQPYIPGRTWGWGSIGQCMDVGYSSNAFIGALLAIPDRPSKAVAVLVQTVQRSAHPDAYAKWEALAWALLAAYWRDRTDLARLQAQLTDLAAAVAGLAADSTARHAALTTRLDAAIAERATIQTLLAQVRAVFR